MLNVRLAGDHLFWKTAVHLAVALMSLMVSFYAVFFPTRCLGRDLGLYWVIF